jgi:D-lysine oxidase
MPGGPQGAGNRGIDPALAWEPDGILRTMDIVLGAGIVGTSVGLELLARGREVVLVDRSIGDEVDVAGASFGNAGLIEVSDLMPRAFPANPLEILRYGSGTDMRVQIDFGFLPRLVPWLWRYRWNSMPRSVARIARDITPLFLESYGAHKRLAEAAGASHLLRGDGWLHLYRSGPVPADMDEGITRARDHGMKVDILGPEEIAACEPTLLSKVQAAIHWRNAASVSDPGGLVRALRAHFERLGGGLVKGEAKSLRPDGAGWAVDGDGGKIVGENAVIALGPWASDVIKPMGYRLPLAVKRGYHMHYSFEGPTLPRLPVIDLDRGFVLTPMTKGIRLTTGIEFAGRDAPPNPRQIDLCEPYARELLALGERLDETPWVGSRPCTADMRPIIGPAPRHKGVWFAFGHAHHGLTLGPVTGRLLAEQMTGERPFIAHEPFLPARFE